MKKLVLIGMLILGGTLCLAASSAGLGPSFAAPRSYPAGPDPVSVAVGDLNADGKPDLATANVTAGTLSVLLNGGNGSLGGTVDYPAGSPSSVAIGDVNGDGKADLVTGNFAMLGRFPTSMVAVLVNRGDGSFVARVEYPIGQGHGLASVATGDLNGDGKLDVAAINYDSVSVLLNSGNGFQLPVAYPTGSVPQSLAIGDLNGDGKADLAIANRFGSSVSVLLNSGTGGFQPKVDYASGSNPDSVAIGDLNGDGKADLATANAEASTVSILLGNGGGSFSAKVDSEVGLVPASIAIVDLNGDHKPDIATANAGENTLTALSNRGDGHIQAWAETEVRAGSQPVSLATGDLNGDGKPDLVTADLGANAVSVLANTTVSCNVPRVTKKALPAAKRAIARAHCRVGTMRRTSSRITKGRVISQRPKPGTVMPAGTKINLVVSRGRARS